MSGAARPLQPASAYSPAGDTLRANNSTSPGPNRPPGGRRPKRTLIESACSACRRRKSKCDGARPACSRCTNLRTDCHYEAEEGESRWSALRRRNQILEAERDQLRDLVATLRARPETEALDIFHRIRTATTQDDLSSITRQIRDSAASMPPPIPGQHISGTASAEQPQQQQRLPPIQAFLDVSARPAQSPGVLPPTLRQTTSTGSDESRSSNASTHFSMPETMQPALHQSTLPQLPRLSSEDSSSSITSNARDPRPYQMPP